MHIFNFDSENYLPQQNFISEILSPTIANSLCCVVQPIKCCIRHRILLRYLQCNRIDNMYDLEAGVLGEICSIKMLSLLIGIL